MVIGIDVRFGPEVRCPQMHSAISSGRSLIELPAAGRVAVKDRVNATALAAVEDFRRDSDLFAEGVRNPEAQERIQTAFKRGFQTRDAEMNLARLLGELGNR